MIEQNHVSHQQLRSLIAGTGESRESQQIAEHVHACPACRKDLERLAAESAIWQKVPAMLKEVDRRQTSLPPSPLREPAESECGTEAEDWSVQWPISEWLERPSHPEMLGRIGKYDVEREIGRGGMGVVLKGFDSELNRPVAIKMLAPHLASQGMARKRFAQEAMSAGGILHPNVIPVYGVHHEGKTSFMVMPYIEGPSLQTLIEQDGPLTETEIVRVAVQISSGLAAAHAQGLVHRDIKPANILVDGGVHRVMITDFGLARAEDDASLTRTGWLLGTPNYMSPEQTRGQRADGRSDLFSLGSLLYFLASGRLPFRAESALGVLHRIQHEEPTPIRQVNRLVSKTLAAIIAKLLKKDPAARFQSAAELRDLLEKHLAYLHQPDISKPPPVHTSVVAKRSPWLVPMSFALLLAIGAIAIVSYWKVPPSSSTLAAGSVEPVSAAADSIETDRDWEGHDLFCEAERLYDLERYQDSLAGFQKASAYENVRAKSLYNIACIQIKSKQFDQAFESLKQASENGFADENHYRTDEDLAPVRQDQRFSALMSRIGELANADELTAAAQREVNQGNLVAAEKSCREALAIQPRHGEAATQLGYVLHLQGRLEDALPWHQLAARTGDSRAMGNYNLACYYALKAQTDLAFEHLQRAIRMGLSRCLSVQRVKQDDDLKTMVTDPRFSAAINEMEQYDAHLRQGLDPDLVAAYRAVGLDPSQYQSQIRQCIPASLVLDYQTASLDLNEYKTLLQNRVPHSLILRYRLAGLNPKEHELSLIKRLEPSEISDRNPAEDRP